MGFKAWLILLVSFGQCFATVIEYGGMYQYCDGGQCDPQCMSPNIWTGGCNCPGGYYTTCFRTIANGVPGYGSYICFCEPPQIMPGGFYGGSYQLDDEADCNEGCRVVNRYQGSCSCPSGYIPSYIRVLTDTPCPGGIIGSHIVACTSPNYYNNGNFLGVFQADQNNNCIYGNPVVGGGCGCPGNSCPWSGTATIDGGQISKVWSCTSSLALNPDPSTVERKILFGYQGWFGTPADPSVGWFHWSKDSNAPNGNTANFDVWPDLSEFSPEELYPSDLIYPDGSQAGLYLASNPLTIQRHFTWMQTYGLDGILLQRFVTEVTNRDDPHFAMRNTITGHVRDSAAATGRVWAIEYDCSGSDPNTLLNVISNDWAFLVQNLGILNSPQYLRQYGLPVVALWGFGFTGINIDQNTALSVINFFKGSGVWVMGGVPYNWRTSSGDSQPNFLEVYQAFDLVMPWAVGRYGDQPSFENLYQNVVTQDITFAQQNNIGYAPVIFPGFSWANLQGNPSIFNQIPRMGGSFFNMQAQQFVAQYPNIFFMKIAMFDEVDEGTAMFKMATSKDQTPVNGNFLYTSVDGFGMDSDGYLCFAGGWTVKNH